jgi:hypothetical protein
MASRYKSDNKTNRGNSFGTAKMCNKLRAAHEAGNLSTKVVIIGSNARLDHVAFSYLGDPSYWWAIAALSGIGWGLQVPAETRLIVPTSINQIKGLQ